MKSTLYRTRLFILVPILFAGIIAAAQTSRRNTPSARDVAREIQRVDREQLLLRAPLRSEKSDQTRVAQLKKMKDDFRALQNINNKMMAEVFSSDDVDYQHMTDMISQVKAKAMSLKSNLALPTNNDSKKVASPSAIDNLKDFRAALLILDKSVMGFVNNPMFQKPDVVEMDLALQASKDLDAVIALSGDLKKLSTRLGIQSKQNSK